MFKDVLARLSANWKSALTVALISIPLSLSLAVASGAQPEVGIITAVWAGMIAAFFGGSHFNIVGPAGALTGLLAAFALTHGPALLPTVAVISGLFIIIAYFLRLERYLVLIPRSVMHGFSLGVALIIGFGQLAFALGLQNLPKHEHMLGTILEIFKHLGTTHLPTFLIFLAFLGILIFLARILPKIPGAVLVTPIGIVVGWLSIKGFLPESILLLSEKFPGSSLSFFTPAQLTFDVALLIPAMSIAFIALLETLISAKIADNMTGTRFNTRKEVMGLGLANIASGFFGGLPATGVFVRTGLNVKSGATHKTSAFVNGLFVALITGVLYAVFTYLPMAVIASILIFAALRMMELAHLKKLWKNSRKDFIVAILVAICMVGIDSVVGLLVGTALALLFFVEKLSEGHFEISLNSADKKMLDRLYTSDEDRFTDTAEIVVYSVKGELTYLNAEAHAERIKEKEGLFSVIVFRMRELGYIDNDGIEVFEELLRHLEAKGKDIYLTSLSPIAIRELKKSDIYLRLEKKGSVFPNTRKALSHLGFTDFM